MMGTRYIERGFVIFNLKSRKIVLNISIQGAGRERIETPSVLQGLYADAKSGKIPIC